MLTVCLNLLIVAGLTVGHGWLMIAALNRAMGLPITHALSHRLKVGHDVLMAAFPLLLGGWLLMTETDLTQAGGWLRLPTLACVYLAVCAVAAVCGPTAAILREHWPPPKALRSTRAERFEITGRIAGPAAGAGPYGLLTRIPGNEFARLELNTKELAVPAWPAECDGLSILHVSDVHFIGTLSRAWFEEVFLLARRTLPDLVVFTGDLLDDWKYLDWIDTTFAQCSAPLGCWFVLGNHDWLLGDVRPIRERLEGLGWYDATRQVRMVSHKGAELAIGGDERPWMGQAPDWSNVPATAARLLLSHTPDTFTDARSNAVQLMLAGHNHGGQIRLPVYGPVYSPSLYGTRFAGGVYALGPMVLHVSRGLGGRHPLRFRCMPEVSTLVVRSPGAMR